jgi:Zn-dependent protease
LAIFNLIPIPPLDGSKVLASLLSDRLLPQFFALERYGFLLILLFLFLGLFQVILFPILNALLQIFVGISFF